ncbi:unnamed protein product [Cochlearia groenlandica]
MKKLYKKGTVHPSPPPQTKSGDNILSLLPITILSLTAVLSPEDREVLSYLISTASYSNDKNQISRLNKTKPHKKSHFDNNHSPMFHCDCFSCYTSYWVRWDTSPSRQLIHEIIDAYEDSLEKTEKKKKKVTGKKNRRKRSVKVTSSFCTDGPSRLGESIVSEFVNDCGVEETEEFHDGDGDEEAAVVEAEEGSVRRFVSFIGEKVFGVWG